MEIDILERQGLNRSHTKVANFVLLNSATNCLKNLPNGSDLSFGAVLRQNACSPLFILLVRNRDTSHNLMDDLASPLCGTILKLVLMHEHMACLCAWQLWPPWPRGRRRGRS